MPKPEPEFVVPDWPAPPRVRAFTTTRAGGVSRPPFDSLNLALHVEDDPAAVVENRAILRQAADLPDEPFWLEQVHGTAVVPAGGGDRKADGAWTDRPGMVCTVLTADCLPVLFSDRSGTRVAAAHAGWRGLLGGVLEQTVAALGSSERLMAWLGPAIGPDHFEVGPEVREAFIAGMPDAESGFRPAEGDRWLADLYRLARLRLAAAGVAKVYGGHWSTFDDPRFYSYRRSPRTGRMASLIWLNPA